MDSIKKFIKSDERLQKMARYLLVPSNQKRPRWWIKNFVNPFFHSKGKKASICSSVRMDVFPFNGFSIGEGSTIEDFSTINNGMGDVKIGNFSRVGISNVVIGPVQVGNHVIIAQNVVMSGLNHSYHDINTPISLQKCTSSLITIDDEVWIGANSIITAGVTVGKHSVVAGGSVVTKDVPSYTIVAGNPAKVIKRFNFQSNTWESVKQGIVNNDKTNDLEIHKD